MQWVAIAQVRDLVATLFLCWALGSCSSMAGPRDYQLPDPDQSLDPAALRQPHLIFACGEWIGGSPPTEDKLFVDVSFLVSVLDAEPNDRPSVRHLAALASHHGEVAYTFHVPAVRAWIATRDIPALSTDPAVSAVFAVADLRRYDWNINVGYKSKSGYTAGIPRYQALGGRVDYRFDAINGIGGLLPDRSVKNLREDPQTAYVESSAPFPGCW